MSSKVIDREIYLIARKCLNVTDDCYIVEILDSSLCLI